MTGADRSAGDSGIPSSEFPARLRKRDAAALEEAIAEHARPLRRAALGMGFAENEAEDLTQEVFITFLEKVETFEGRSQLRTWLFGILYRKALERRRERAREARMDPIDEVFEARFDARGKWVKPPAEMERFLLSEELGEQIRGCMEGLPAAQRAAFVLKEVEEMDSAEICKILDVSATNYGVMMHRARARLRECLETKGWKR